MTSNFLKGDHIIISQGNFQQSYLPAIDSSDLSLIYEKNIQEIAEELGKILGRPIIIEDKFFRILGKFLLGSDDLISVKPQLTDPYLKEFVFKIQKQKSPVMMPPLPKYGVNQSRIVYPIFIGDVIYGYLHVFDKSNPPKISEDQQKIISKFVSALLLKTLIEEVEMQTKEEFYGRLYQKLIFRHYPSDETVRQITSVLKLDLTKPTWLILANISGPVPNSDKRKVLKSFLFERDIDATVICLKEDIFLILIMETKQPFKKVTIISRSHQLIEHISQCYSETTSYITFGRRCLNLEDYYKSYHEATKALDYLLSSNLRNEVLSFDSLGIIGLMTLPEDVDHMLSFSRTILKPLLEYENENPSMKLIQTLACFIQNDCQMKKTASDLFVHINTLRYRLEKIQEISKFDLTNIEVKFNLYLALKILNLEETIGLKNSK